MTLLQSILLGIVQGLTEFPPISSSAHLVIVPYLLNWEIPPKQAFIFDVLVQLGTLLALIIYFRQDLYRILLAMINGLADRQPFSKPESLLGWLLILGTIPAVVAGLFFKDTVELAFNKPITVGLLLFGTAALLVTAELAGKRSRQIESIKWLDALIVGLFQALSLLPGISRSGSTIPGGILRKLDRPSAARFSFLLSVPVMIGAGFLATLDLLKLSDVLVQIPTLLAGFITSAVVGYFAIRWLLAYLVRRSLYIFAAYCVGLGIVVILVYLL